MCNTREITDLNSFFHDPAQEDFINPRCAAIAFIKQHVGSEDLYGVTRYRTTYFCFSIQSKTVLYTMGRLCDI